MKVLILGANGQLARNTAQVSAAVIEASDLDFTILRPGWFTQDDAIDYQINKRASPSRAMTCR